MKILIMPKVIIVEWQCDGEGESERCSVSGPVSKGSILGGRGGSQSKRHFGSVLMLSRDIFRNSRNSVDFARIIFHWEPPVANPTD